MVSTLPTGLRVLSVPQVGLDRDRRFKQGRFECLVACEPGTARAPLPRSGSARRTPGAAVPALFKWLVTRDLQVGPRLSHAGQQLRRVRHSGGAAPDAAAGFCLSSAASLPGVLSIGAS